MPNIKSIDQRKAIRFDTELPANIYFGRTQFQGVIRNISSSGLQFECPTEFAIKLMPKETETKVPNQLSLLFDVPTTPNISIELYCDIIYIRRKSQTRSLLGCSFKDFKEDSRQQLEDYLRVFGHPEA